MEKLLEIIELSSNKNIKKIEYFIDYINIILDNNLILNFKLNNILKIENNHIFFKVLFNDGYLLYAFLVILENKNNTIFEILEDDNKKFKYNPIDIKSKNTIIYNFKKNLFELVLNHQYELNKNVLNVIDDEEHNNLIELYLYENHIRLKLKNIEDDIILVYQNKDKEDIVYENLKKYKIKNKFKYIQ